MFKKIYVVLGAPGSGKGTRSQIIQDKLGIPHISTGSLIRQNTEVISNYNETVSNGILIPDSVIEEILVRELKRHDTSNGYILDGYPRNIEQAKRLDKILSNRKEEITKVFLFEVTLETIHSRVLSRKICGQCSKIYGHMDNISEGDKCPICSGKIVLRTDDNEQTLKNRIDIFFKEIDEIKKYYKKMDKLEIVDGNKGSKEILNVI